MRILVDVLVAVTQLRPDAVLVSKAKLKAVDLAPHYSVGQWAQEPRWRDEWRKIRGMENRAPFDAASQTLADQLAEYKFSEQLAEGLGVAHSIGGLSASFCIEPFSTTHRIVLTREALIEEDNGSVSLDTRNVAIPHVATVQHVHLVNNDIAELGRPRPANGAIMWSQREDLFPCLSFLPRVENQMSNLYPGQPRFAAVFERLRELDRAASRWDPAAANIPDWQSKVSPESASRRSLCMFQDLDGEQRVFDLHARFTPGAGRIHFRLDAGSVRKMVVAHVGDKIKG